MALLESDTESAEAKKRTEPHLNPKVFLLPIIWPECDSRAECHCRRYTQEAFNESDIVFDEDTMFVAGNHVVTIEWIGEKDAYLSVSIELIQDMIVPLPRSWRLVAVGRDVECRIIYFCRLMVE